MEHKKRDRASGVIVWDGKVLLIKRIKPTETYYVFPGGGIEEGESPEAAVIREVKEETNIDARKAQELFCLEHGDLGRNYFFNIDDFIGGELRFNGPEVRSDNNQYIPEWVAVSALDGLALRSEAVKEKVIRFLRDGHYTQEV